MNSEIASNYPENPSHSSTNLPLIPQCPHCTSTDILLNSIQSLPQFKSFSLQITCNACSSSKTQELQDYISYLSKASQPKCINYCFKHTNILANIYCQNCNLYMCNICYSYHLAFEPTHITTDHNDNNNSAYYCKMHPEQNMDFYCEECKVNLCIQCSKKRHRNHNVIQLREYWEKVYSKLGFKTIEHVEKYISKILKNYDDMMNEQIHTLGSIILSFQNLKMVVEKNHIINMKNNSLLAKLIVGVYSNFYSSKYFPKLNIIQSVERLRLGNMFDVNSIKQFKSIVDNLAMDYMYLTKVQKEMSKRIIIKEYNNDNISKDIIINTNYNDRCNDGEYENYLGKKKDAYYGRDIPINEDTVDNNKTFKSPCGQLTTLTTNANTLSNNYSVNYLKDKISKGINNIKVKKYKHNAETENQPKLKQGNIFNFDPDICAKYLNSCSNVNNNNNNIESPTETRNFDSTKQFFETFSNTSSIYETIDCIQLGRVEDNKLYQRNKQISLQKKKMQLMGYINQSINTQHI